MSEDDRTGGFQRTDEERESARLERERRRLAKAAGKKRQQTDAHAPPSPTLERSRPNVADPGRLHLPDRSRLHLPRVPHRLERHSRSARVGVLVAFAGLLAALIAGAALLATHGHSKPPPAPAVVTVVIPEGETAAQIAQIASSDGVKGDYLAAMRSFATARPSSAQSVLSPSHYGAPAHTHTLEGFLFPATYELYAGAPVSRFIAEQLEAFKQNFGGAEVARAKALGVTPYQLLTIASMIEREAAIARDRPLVAAVIYNRLRLHMPLGIDATIRYALHDDTGPLTEAQLKSSSPYNTRTHAGLPPTPISNPGMASIQAAARPAKVSYLYYVNGADGCGDLVFSTSYARFEEDAAAYRAALARNGGKPPTCRKHK